MNPLLIPELFNCVLDCLVLSAPMTLEERSTLAALARTCSSFAEPSLNRLWWRLESLLPLVRGFADNLDEIRVKASPSPEEWLVINRYHHRIREVKLGTDQLSLHFLRCTNLILPNLKVLRWEPKYRHTTTTDSEMVSLSSLWSLFVPQIDTLELALDNSTFPEFQSLLENYPVLSPRLNAIKFEFQSSPPFQSPCLFTDTLVPSQVIRNHTDWKRVELSCAIDNDLLRHLGLSCKLEVISLALDPWGANPLDETYFKPADTPFRNATRLALTVWNHFDGVTSLLRRHDQAFNTFGVTLRNTRVTTMEMSAFFTAIVSPLRIKSLQSLTFSRPCTSLSLFLIPANEGQGLSYETLRPIMSLVHLRELVIALELPIAINDGEFVDLIRNWPCLEVFLLMGRLEDYTKIISLKGLLSLLVCCPQLHEIGLSVDARQIPSADDVSALCAGVDICLPAVTSLIFQDAPIEDPDLVEAFLFKHLPNAFVDMILTQFGEARHAGMWYSFNVRRKDRIRGLLS